MEKLKADEEKSILFQKKIERYKTENKPIIYIDGIGFEEEMPRTHRYTKVEKRCYDRVYN